MNRCAVAGFCSAVTSLISCTAMSIFASDVIWSQDHLTLRFSADDFPRLLTISNSTRWPSLSVDRPRLLHSRNVHKHIAPAALGLDESIAFGRIKPLHSPGRHQSSPSGKRGRPSNLHECG